MNKSYSASYVWAQLTIWWKQTVEKPEATLSQERRGTVSNPTFEQSFLDTHQKDLPFDYPYGVTIFELYENKLNLFDRVVKIGIES